MLQDKAMLIKVKLNTYNPYKRDREMSAVVAQAYNADKDFITTTKRLVPKQQYASIQNIDTQIRNFVYHHTRPWLDDGLRILPTASYFDFCDGLSDLLGKREQFVREFVEAWPQTRQAVITALGGSYRDGDVPDDISNRFGIETLFMPIPRQGDFRAEGLDPQDIEKIETETIQRIEAQFESRDLWDRIRRVLTTQSGTVGERLKAYGTDLDGKVINKFHDTLIENVRELVKVMPKLNIAGDEEVNTVVEQLEKEVCAYDPDSLREDDTLRMSVAEKADDILKRVYGYMA